ncbi:arginase family protein [Agromyces sp. NPDC056523]|uniref:arginase family protein n=1 Tax=Agromyces sp. NPDC056523 TaxID=3345850 RepID=UPI00366AC7C3
MAGQLRAAIAGRPVYVHVDCELLDPGIVPTDYSIPDGMTLDQLFACAEVIAEHEVVGIQIAELETDETPDGGSDGPARRMVASVEPIFATVT